jgi:ABC-2 type transport system ATP-binding protein
VRGGSGTLAQVIAALVREDVPVGEVGLRRATLDEVFLTLTGTSSDDGSHAAGSTEAGG